MINGGIWGVKFWTPNQQNPNSFQGLDFGLNPPAGELASGASFAPFLTIVQVGTVYSRIFPR